MVSTTFAERVASAVVAKIEGSGTKVTWLSDQTGIPLATMNRRLRGLSAFDLNEIERIAAALRVPVTDLLASPADRAPGHSGEAA